MRPRPHRVRRVRRETADTITLDLEPADGGAPLAFRPGQFNMLWAFGVGEIPVSVSGDPARRAPLTHTVRGVGAVSRALAGLGRGDFLGVRGPYGRGWPVQAAAGTDVVILAGGIGLAPLRPALYHLLAHRDRYGRIAVLYGARTPADLLYHRELAVWRGRFDLEVEATVDHAESGWRGPVGVVTTLIEHAHFDPDDTTALLCGPEVMMRFTARDLVDCGVAPERIHVSLERNMKCAVGLCGHCQLGPYFVCRDGPVLPLPTVAPFFDLREL